jgi:hypothetical protein
MMQPDDMCGTSQLHIANGTSIELHSFNREPTSNGK